MAFDRLGDLLGGPTWCALEHHMFEQMRNAVHLGCLETGASPHPHADGYGFNGRHLVADDPNAVGKRGYLDVAHGRSQPVFRAAA